MKRAVFFIMLLLASVFAYAEEPMLISETDITTDTVEFETAAIADEAVPDEAVDAALTAEVKEEGAFAAARDRLRYAFTFKKEKKAEMGLALAQRKLVLSEKQAAKGNTEAAANAEEQYRRWMERSNQAIANLPSETGLLAAAKIQNQIELNRKIAEKAKERIRSGNLTEADKEKIIERLETAKANAEKVKLAAEKRVAAIEERLENVENLTPEEIERRKIEARLGNAGQKASAEAFVKIAEKDIAKAQSVIEGAADADADKLAKANEMISKAQSDLELAKAALNAGKYSEAKELALKARRVVMDAYIRSKFNALPAERKDEIRAMTPEERQALAAKAREAINIRERERATDAIKDRVQERVCAQVVTSAVNPETKDCREFPTPCDVPAAWRRVASCTNTIANTIGEVVPSTTADTRSVASADSASNTAGVAQ